MKLILFITSNLESGISIAHIWQEAGAPGVTIIHSHGLYRLQQDIKRESLELPIHVARSMASTVTWLLQNSEHNNHVLLSIVPADMVDNLIKLAEEEVGDLEQPNNGVAFILPVEQAFGISYYQTPPKSDD